MGKIKLLLVEDDAAFSFIIKGCLELTGNYDVSIASDGKEGLEKYAAFIPDIIVADIEIPIMSGIELVSVIRRKDTQIPILFASARTSPKDLIEGYNLGIDNYIRKPFLPEELNAHVQAILRRSQSTLLSTNETTPYLLKIGKYLFDTKAQTLQRQDRTIKLTERESQIILLLYQQKGKIVKREDILTQCWEHSDFYTSRSLDVFINKLRKYFKEDPGIEIKTVRKKGILLDIKSVP